MENSLIGKISNGADTLENMPMGVEGESGPQGILVTSRQPYSQGA